MTSSQALMFNLFGPMAKDPNWTLEIISRCLGRSDIHKLIALEIEYAPRRRSLYLNDMTRIDVFFVVESDQGIEAIALELKFADRFNSRKVSLLDGEPYRALADETGIWKSPLVALGDPTCNQLLRCHALAASFLATNHGGGKATLIVVHHKLDAEASALVTGYRAHLADQETCVAVSLTEFVESARNSAPSSASREQMEQLEKRYLADQDSEMAWNQFALQASSLRSVVR